MTEYILLIIILILTAIFLFLWKKIIMIGCGAVGTCFIEMLKLEGHRTTSFVIYEPRDLNPIIGKLYPVKHHKISLNEDNLHILREELDDMSLIIDVSVHVDAIEVMKIIDQYSGCKYINTSMESWKYVWDGETDPWKSTLHYRDYIARNLFNNTNNMFYVNFGQNPGLISTYVARGLLDYATSKNVKIEGKSLARLSKELGLDVIHVSEVDTQVPTKQLEENVFYNTWSCEGFIEEAMDPICIGLGTHEKGNFILPTEGYKNVGILKKRGMDAYAKSYTKSGEIKGYVIPHAENVSLSKFLEYEGHRPSVYYVYQCSEIAKQGIENIKKNAYAVPRKTEVLWKDTIGKDEVGALLCFKNGDLWWTGSTLSTEQTKKMGFMSGPTLVQVAICLYIAMRLPIIGYHTIEDFDMVTILEYAKKYLGDFYSGNIDGNIEMQFI